MQAIAPRFWSKVRKGVGCWTWKSYRHPSGYGVFRLHGKSEFAHRVAYRITKGPIPEGMQVCHRCDNRPCCHPAHLFLGTNLENHLDAAKKGRHGKRGKYKLQEEDVIAIRKMNKTQVEIAEIFGVTQAHVSKIKAGRVWA